MVSRDNGVSELPPCFLNKWSGWTTVAVNNCAAIGTNGWCGLLKESYGCERDVGGVKVCAVVQLCGYLIVIKLKCNEVIGADAKLDGCGNVANTRRDDEFYFCEEIAMCVVNLHTSG